jgi:hypothetical protein
MILRSLLPSFQLSNPLLKAVPVTAAAMSRRPFGLCSRPFTVPDDFDAPLPDGVLREFDGR